MGRLPFVRGGAGKGPSSVAHSEKQVGTRRYSAGDPPDGRAYHRMRFGKACRARPGRITYDSIYRMAKGRVHHVSIVI